MAPPGRPVLTDEQLAACSARVVSRSELRQNDGSAGDGTGPVWLSLRGVVYDVSAGRGFYGPGSPYSAFAGRDCTRNLATMKFNEEFLDVGNVDGLSEDELKTLGEWEAKFAGKYTLVGKLEGSTYW